LNNGFISCDVFLTIFKIYLQIIQLSAVVEVVA